MGRDSLKYKQTPPFLVSESLSDLKGPGEKPFMKISSLEIFSVNIDSHTPNMSKSYVACKDSMRGILAKSLAGRLSKFQTAKERFCFKIWGPGLTSTVPDKIKRICKIIAKKECF